MQHPLQVGGEQHTPVQLQEEFISSFSIPRTLEKVFDSSQVSFQVAVSQQNASGFEQPSHEKTHN